MKEPSLVTKSDVVHRDDTFYRPHPGSVFKRRCLSKGSANMHEIAKGIGLSVRDFSGFINCRLDLNAKIAEKIALYTGISMEKWLYYQECYDLYKASLNTSNDKMGK